MKVLHSAALLRPSQGMLNQMKWEQAAAVELGLNWNVRMYCPKGCIGPIEILEFSDHVASEKGSKLHKLRCWFKLRIFYYQWLLSLKNKYDVFILRYYVHDPFQYYFLRRVNKPVFFVHHTLEVPELAMPGQLSDKVRALLESIIGRNTLGYAKGLIGVTGEILDYEILRCKYRDYRQSYFIYPNGIDVTNNTVEDDRESTIELLFVCSFFSPWHGLDLLIASLKNNKSSFKLHIVGDVSEEDLEYLVTDSRVVLHGKLNHDEISKLSYRCHCGLSSFALFRNNMKEACTLKVREYLKLGLPVYAGYHDVFPADFLYYQSGDANISDILLFAKRFEQTAKNDVAIAARKYIDKCELLNKLHQQIYDII